MAATAQLSSYLAHGPRRRPSDMHTRSGYPVWVLAAVWHARGESDAAVIAEYGLDPAEWEAAKQYYFAHQAVMDAVRILNEEEQEELEPGETTLEQLLAEHRSAPASETPSE